MPSPSPDPDAALRAAAAALLGAPALRDPARPIDDTLAALDALLARDPAHRVALSLTAALLAMHRRFDAADAAFAALVRHHPHDGDAWTNYGRMLRTIGRTGDAAAAYRRAADAAARPGPAWWALASLKAARLDATDVAAMRAALAAAQDDDDRLHLHFALGAALGEAGDHAAAFAELDAGNALRRRRAPHDAAATSAGIRRATAPFTPALLAARGDAGAPASGPIFIVGMPRSGSTLVEQILASHPLVEGTEELHELHHVATRMTAAAGADSALAAAVALAPDRLRASGEDYLAGTRRYRATDRPFFTDKMPSNWIYAGLIRLILPAARIVDVRRHPLACGFANYAQHYARGNNFAYDLAAIGRFYADYVRHMAQVDRVAPGLVHRVHHEALVEHPEREVRRLLDHFGLPFDPACLRFHETARAVHTPSTDQVRRPINRDGIDRWRAYEPWLQPLASALGPVLDHYPAPPPGW